MVELGVASEIVPLHLGGWNRSFPNAQASAAVNSLALLDLVQIAALGRTPIWEKSSHHFQDYFELSLSR